MRKSAAESQKFGAEGEEGVGDKDPASSLTPGPRLPARNSRLSLWLFPATYVLHILEEWFGGFPVWFSRVMGREMSGETFLSMNLWALAGMTLGVVLAAKFKQLRWLPVGFGTVVLVNAVAHLGASVLTRSYSPGVVTGTLIWLPLGALTLARARRELPRRHLFAGLAAGVLMHAAVTLSAFFAG